MVVIQSLERPKEITRTAEFVFHIPEIPSKASAVDAWEDLLVVCKTTTLWSGVEGVPILGPLDELVHSDFFKTTARAIASGVGPPESFIS